MKDMNGKRRLIAFFSRAGKNYVGGSIVHLPVGNTEVVAKMIRDAIGGDLFRIDTVVAYPADYTATTEVAKKELADRARPELVEQGNDLAGYDTIFLGYPNWWGTMPMAVFTFLEACDFKGKTLLPFCTHEGSGLGRSERDIASLCPDARILPGLAIPGSQSSGAHGAIAGWLNRTGIA